ncbi:MAG TPA: hypothetical protein DHV85_09675 [Candidatus Accumulibacter sp.]|nr:hypothetical protein [Accumulibacter sp.]
MSLRLFKHQQEALSFAQTGASYVLTTGTGSGKSLAYFIPIVDAILKARVADARLRTRAIVICISSPKRCSALRRKGSLLNRCVPSWQRQCTRVCPKIHISDGGKVFTTLDAPGKRFLTLDGNQYVPGDRGAASSTRCISAGIAVRNTSRSGMRIPPLAASSPRTTSKTDRMRMRRSGTASSCRTPARSGSGEGRSSATTMLTLASLRYLYEQDAQLSAEAKKVLGFSDNRQDAALQVGHFNDFLQILLQRAALLAAVQVSAQQEFNERNRRRSIRCAGLRPRRPRCARQRPASGPGHAAQHSRLPHLLRPAARLALQQPEPGATRPAADRLPRP